MLTEIIHWAALALGTVISFIYFKNLGDLTQAVFKVERKGIVFAIRHEKALVVTSLAALAVSAGLHFGQGAGVQWAFASIAGLDLAMIGFTLIWVHAAMRNQQDHARYFSNEEATSWLRPEESVIVIENAGEARAHPDHHLSRPHLAGSPDGLGGDNVIMTYCALTHLGVGYKAEIDGQPLDLEVAAQHGNNLIMKDRGTSEPIQQVYGTRECDGRRGAGMQAWPTFRMSFRGFKRAYPEGTVFLNPIASVLKNPLLALFDRGVELAFLNSLIPHHNTERLMFETMDVEDPRLPRKALVWGFEVGEESVAYTEEFVRANGNLVNATIGERRVVVAYDPEFESLGVFYNETDGPIRNIDFWGESDQGRLARVENLKPGAYWCVWVNYFPETKLNVNDGSEEVQAA
ncbi:MAG: hypothetical protein CL908_26190 [Deltaproteobacteria bacterium]|nr:hypothetical protein [Deltaproteobacteria bacterium]